MPISSTGSSRLQQRPPVRTEAAEVAEVGSSRAPFKGSRSESKAAGAVQSGDAMRKALADGFDGAEPAGAEAAALRNTSASVVDQLQGASSFEDCAPEPAVALQLPNGSVVGADLVDIKGTRSDSGNTGIKTDGEDCSPPTIGEVGVTI